MRNARGSFLASGWPYDHAVANLETPKLEGFPAGGPVANGPAVTVGRPNRNYVFQHGTASIYEALFRWSLVRMVLMITAQPLPRGVKCSQLRRNSFWTRHGGGES